MNPLRKTRVVAEAIDELIEDLWGTDWEAPEFNRDDWTWSWADEILARLSNHAIQERIEERWALHAKHAHRTDRN